MAEPTFQPSGPADTASPPPPNGSVDGVKNSMYLHARMFSKADGKPPAAQDMVSNLQNSSTAQSLNSGPVAENVKDQTSKTSDEFQKLAQSRATPAQPAATGQSLTHYHSLFYNLFSWQNPRASAIAFSSTIVFIFMARYLNIIRYLLKLSYVVLGITAGLEIFGKVVFDSGIATRFRPRKYYTIPREALDRSMEDLEQLINFFVIESQRIVFAENIPATLAAFAASLVFYGLIRFVPLWGLSLIATCVLYLTPLAYIRNRETIDELIAHSTEIAQSQAAQLKDMTAQHTGRATATMKATASEYSSKANSYMGRKSSGQTPQSGVNTSPSGKETLKAGDFPSVPKQEPAVSAAPAPVSESPDPAKTEPQAPSGEPVLSH
ncbi:MAG: hypothetical protein M1831_002116 [Alyxoria varia]|nr:MAG: hypothetical protein M1831_002116 [Alyxoria varia]